jgi:hypothetical protein
MATVYGLVQPFLPAAIADHTGSAFAQALAIVRSLGWFFILPFLIYAPFVQAEKRALRNITTYFALLVWAFAILASFRSGGDQWDNVRYRVVFLVIQMFLVGWIWDHTSRTRSPWLARVAILVAVVSLLFLQWYLGRYYGIPSLDIRYTLALSIFCILAFIGFAVIRTVQTRRAH